jgi:hypothetical protein
VNGESEEPGGVPAFGEADHAGRPLESFDEDLFQRGPWGRSRTSRLQWGCRRVLAQHDCGRQLEPGQPVGSAHPSPSKYPNRCITA